MLYSVDHDGIIVNQIDVIVKRFGPFYFSPGGQRTIPDLYNQINSQKGYTYGEPNIADSPFATGTVRGSIANGTAQVIIKPLMIAADADTSAWDDYYQYRYIITALHETIHLADSTSHGVYTDAELAAAVVNLPGTPQSVKDLYDRLDHNDSNAMSNFWAGVLFDKCPRK